MIERKFVAQNFKEFQIKEFVRNQLSRVGLSGVKLQRTSVGERVIVTASRPGLVVGRGGATIQKLTKDLKEKFNLENPQIEIEEIKDFNLDATVVAESIANQLERFGTQRFKGIGHRTIDTIMKSNALGVEILISGKIPSSRAKTWRFADGYMKKCGDLAITGVDSAIDFVTLKTGVVGIQVRIMPATTKLPDQISFDKRERDLAASQPVVEEVNDNNLEAEVEAKEKEMKKKSAKTRTSKTSGAQKSDSSSDSSKKTTKKAASKKASDESKEEIKEASTDVEENTE